MALLLRRSPISSLGRKPFPTSGALLLFSTSSNASNSRTLISVSDYLIHQYDFSPEAALEVSSHKKSPKKVYALITLLKDSGFSKSQLEKAICRGSVILLKFKVDTIQRKLKGFRDTGFDPSEIAEMISSDPWILQRGTKRLVLSLSALTKILGSYAKVAPLKSSWFLKVDFNNTLLPNIDFLKQCGVDSGRISRYVAHSPRFLLQTPEKIQKCVEVVDRIGVPRQSGRYLVAVRTVSSMSSESWELKWDLFRSLGFSEDEILCMVRRIPQVLSISEKKIRDVWNVMAGIEELGPSILISRPEIFLFSVEKRLKPRVQAYQVLEKKKLLKKKMQLTRLCSISDKKFVEFVSRYEDELGDEFAAFQSFNVS